MKKIFGFLLAFVVALSFAGNLLAQEVYVRSGAKVRYMIEKKTVTQDEADTYASQGYVDLWAYALFNVGYWEKGSLTSGGTLTEDLIVFNGGTMQQWLIRFTSPTQSFMICDKNGDYVSGGPVLFSQPAISSTCTGRTIKQLSYSNGPQGVEFTRNVCPDWSYGNSPDAGTGVLNASNCRDYIDIYTDASGVQWYRMKLFEIRYDYPKVNGHGTTFYTRFWSDAEIGAVAPTSVASTGASTFTLSALGYRLKGSDNWDDKFAQDWQRTIDTRFDGDPSRTEYGFVTGGVEIIADPEFILTAGATCGGSDLQGSFKVNNWNGKSWSDYKTVKMYVNTNGGTRKALAIGTDLVFSGTALCNASGAITATGTAADFNYSLSSSAYMMNGKPADSLIWAFEDKDGKVVEVKTELVITVVPKLYFAASDASISSPLAINAALLPRPGGVMTVDDATQIIGKWTCKPFEAGGSPNIGGPGDIPGSIYGCGHEGTDISTSLIKQAYLYRSETLNGTYAVRKGPNTQDKYTQADFVGTSGYYFLKASYKGCDVYTDTVQIKVKKTITPQLTMDFKCGTELHATANVLNADSDPTDWEWVITTTTSNPADRTSGYGFFVENTTPVIFTAQDGSTTYNIGVMSQPSGKSCGLMFGSGPLTADKKMFCIDLLPSSHSNVWNVTPPSDYRLPGKRVYVRCKIDGVWSNWGYYTLPSGNCIGSGSTIQPPMQYKMDVNVDFFSMGISARECPGNMNSTGSMMYCSLTDTVVDLGTTLHFRVYFSGAITMTVGEAVYQVYGFTSANPVPLTYGGQVPSVIYWQVLDEATNKWATWAITPATESTKLNGALHYIESPATTIMKAGKYRAVFSMAGDCTTITTTENNTQYSGDTYDPRKSNVIYPYSSLSTNLGTYAQIANVGIKTNIIPGKIKGRIDNTVWGDGPLNMCYSSQLDLKVENYSVAATDLTWQILDGSIWKDITPAVTGDAYNNISIEDGTDLYAGRTVTFRVKSTSGSDEAFTDPFTVTVYKAKTLGVGYLGNGGVVKDTVAGYCYNSTVYPRVQDGSTPITTIPAGVRAVTIQYTRTSDISSYSFPTNSNWLTYVSGYTASDVLAGTWNLYRAVSYNGPTSTPSLCRADGSPIVVKMNPQVRMGSLNTISEVCSGLDTTLTVSGSANISVYNWAVYKGSNNLDQAYANQGTSLRRSYAEGTYNVMVQGYGVFGNTGTNDTTRCDANLTYTTIKSVVCTKPAPTVSPNPICAGESDVTLTWSEAFDAGKHTLQDSTTGGWKNIDASDYTVSVSGTTSTFTLKKSLFTASGSPVGHKFRINEDPTTGTSSSLLVVNPIPDAPTITDLSDQSVCEKSSFTFKPKFTNKTSQEWYKESPAGSGNYTDKKGTGETLAFNPVATGDAGKYKLLAINRSAAGCADSTWSNVVTLTVNPAPTQPKVGDLTATICAGASHKFEPTITPATTAQPAGSKYIVTWTVPTGAPVGTAAGTDNKDYTVTTLSSASSATYNYTIKVKVETAAGCTDSTTPPAKATLNVQARPAGIGVTMDNVKFCSNETVQLTAKPSATTGTANKYEWFKGSDATGTAEATTTTATYTPTGITPPTSASPVSTQDYTVKVTFGANGCEATETATAKVTVVKKPDPISIAFNPTSVEVCEGAAINVSGTITPASNNGTYTYTWTPSAPGGSTDANISIAKAQTSDAGTYTLTVDATYGDATTKICKTTSPTQSITLKVNANPILTGVGIAATDDKLCTGDKLNLTATPTPKPANGVTATYQWYSSKLSDTSASNHVGTNSNTYSVTTATTTPTDYSVRVTYSSGSCSTVVADEKLGIVIVDKPAITSVIVSPDNEEVCQNGTAPTFTATVDPATASAGSYTYKWQNGGTDISGALGLTYTPTNEMATAGTYNYKFIVTATNTQNGHSCTDSKPATATLQVKATPNLSSVTVADQAGCDKVTLSATATPSGSYKYQWYTGTDTTAANIISGATGATYEATASGSYAVRVIAGANGCELRKFGTGTATVVTTPAVPTVSLSLNPNQTEFCSGDNLTITASPAPDGTKYTYNWTNPGGTASDNVVTLTNMQTTDGGTYSLSVTETAVNGSTTCTSPAGTASTAITVKQKPVISGEKIEGDEEYCEDETISLKASASSIGTPSYNWQYSSDGTSFTDLNPAQTTDAMSIPNAQTSHSGTYKVVITYTNSTNAANTCEAVAEVTKTVTVNKQPNVGTLTLSGDATVCEGTAVTLTATVTGSVVDAGTRTYIWKKDGTVVATHPSDANTDTYTVPATETAGSYTYTCEVSDVNDNCSDSDSKTHSLTINAMPTNMVVEADDVDICAGTALTLSAKTATATGATASKYEWFSGATATGTPLNTSTTTSSYQVAAQATTGASGQYTLRVTFGVAGTTCTDFKDKTITVVVLEQPDITGLVFPKDTIVCQGTGLTFTPQLTPAPGTGIYNYTYKWNNTVQTDIGYTHPSGASVGDHTYRFDAYVEVKNDAITCSADTTATVKVTVTKPADLSAIAVSGAATDKCLDDGATTLSITGIVNGIPAQTVVYQWYKDNTLISGATLATYSVPAVLAFNGKYSCKVTVAATTDNPCSAEETTPQVDMTYKICSNEKIEKGGTTNQDDKAALLCAKGNENSPASVKYEKPSVEPAAITKVTWFKMESPANIVPDPATATATRIKEQTPPFTYPLSLTQQEVFSGVTANRANIYVWIKVERGSVVTYSNTYRFVRVENAPKITDLDIAPKDDTICFDKPQVTEHFTVSNAPLAAPGTVYGTWGITAKVQPNTGNTGVQYMWKTHNDPGFSSATDPTYNDVVINSVVNQAKTEAKAVSAYFYQLGTTENTCRDTSAVVTGMVTTTEPPVITSFLDADSKNAKTICASETEADYPTLTVTVAKGEVEKWERSANNGSTWTDITSSVTSSGKTTYKLVAADVAKPNAGAANIINKYRVTVKNGSKCGAVTAEYTLTVVSLPDLASVDITPTTLTFCGSGSLVANPKKADGTDATGVTYQWQKSTTGSDGSWADIAGATAKTQNLSAPDNNYYRCVVTAETSLGSVKCPVSVTSDAVQVEVSENTAAGTPAIADLAICESQTTTFTLTDQTGSITKIEISNSNSFPAGSNTVEVTPGTTPYTIDPSATDIAALLSTTSRKTTLHVRATVKSGNVCNEVTGAAKTVDVYKPAPKIAIDAIDPLCANKTIAPNSGYSPAIESAFEQITWTYAGISSNATTLTLSYSALAPKFEDDTTYTLTATVNNTVLSGVCGPTDSDPVTFKVNRKAVAPQKSADVNICAGDSYTVSATRPAKSALVWLKDGAALPSGEAVTLSENTESITVTNAAQGKYVYTIRDKTACGQEDATVTVTVNQKPVAGTISVPAGTNGDFCSGETVQVTADAGTYTLPKGGQITWQVCTDKTDYDNTKQSALEMTGNAYSKPSTAFTPGTIYYIRYGVSGPTCETVYSDWQEVKVIEKPTIGGFTVSSGNNAHICEGTEVTLTISGKEGLEYEIFSNTTPSNTGGTSIQTGTMDASGTLNFKVTPSTTTSYYTVLTDAGYGGSGSCGTSEPSTVMTVNVDAKPVGGSLIFTNIDITDQPTDGGKKLAGKVGEHTAQLELQGASGTSKVLKGESDKGVAVNGGNINTTASLPLTTDHMDVTQLWAVVSSGVCPDAYSDTVELTVEVGTKPTLTISSPICVGGTPTTRSITVPNAVKDELNVSSLKLQYRKVGDADWTKVSDATFTQATDKLSVAIAESTISTLPAGDYEFSFLYVIGSADEAQSNTQTLHIDATSVGGTIAASADKVCVGGTSPVISLSGHTGDITGTYYLGTTNTGSGTSVSSSTDADNLYSVPTADLSRSGWYQVAVKNGACPEVRSDAIEVVVIAKPKAGNLAVDHPVCYKGTDEATVTLSGNSGSSIVWKTSSTQNGTYTDVPNTDATTYKVGGLTDHLFVKVAVNTDAVCGAVESDPVEVKVYDTLKIATHPADQNVVEGNNATFTVAAATGGLLYSDGNAFGANSAASYQWQFSTDGGTTWSIVSDGTKYSGATTATLTVSNASIATDQDNKFRCIVTATHCGNTVTSEEALLHIFTDLEPGTTNSLTACECYYSSDEATYYVTGASGQGELSYRWEVNKTGDNADWVSLESVFPDGLTTICRGENSDTIVFFRIGDLDAEGVLFIRAVVSDEVNTTGLPTTGKAVEVCMQHKPVYTFAGNIVCERDAAGNAVDFVFTANPPTIHGREIKYAYALQSDPTTFTDITNGKEVDFGGGKKLSFALATDNLSIPASSAIPFEADSMVLRMEVRSCYTPAPLEKNTDTTIYAVLRVDRTPDVDLLRDTTVCKGSDVELVAAYTLYNSTIPGNVITVSIDPGVSDQPMPDDKTLEYLVKDIQNTAKYTAKVKTSYCGEKTDEATITVVEIPVLVSVSADSVCAGSSMNFVADVTNYDVNTCTLTWQKWNTITNDWDAVGSGTTYTKSNATTDDAGKYRLHMEVLVPSCAETIDEEFDFKVKVIPELYLTPNPYPGNIMTRNGQPVTVTANAKTVADMGYDPAYVILAPVTTYKWYAQDPNTTGFDQLTGSNFTGLVNGGTTGYSITFMGSETYDSTLFYVEAVTDCGNTAETQRDTLRVTDRFTITAVTPTPGLLCDNDESAAFTILVNTSLHPTDWAWQVSTDNGNTWSDIAAGAVAGQSPATYAITAPAEPDGTEFSLTINRPTVAMNEWMYRAWATDGTDWDTTTRREPVVSPQTIPAPAFTCADNAVLERTQPVVVIGGTPVTSDFTAKASCLPDETIVPSPGYQYDYWVRKPEATDSAQKGSGKTYAFTPETDTGIYDVYFVVSNQCGSVTAMDSVRVIENPQPKNITAIGTEPGDEPTTDHPLVEEIEKETDITVDICEGNTLYLAATYTGGPAESFHWQIDGANIPVPMSSPYSLRGDTLVISPVMPDIDGKVFRCRFDMPGNVSEIYSQTITVHVSGTPNVTNTWVSIMDVTPDHDLDTGQALPGATIELTAEGLPDSYDHICFYQAFLNENGEIDSVEELHCGPETVYELTTNATVADHDATWYYVQVHNKCGYDSSSIHQLRIFDTLAICWIPDTTILNPSGGWDPASNTDPKPEELIVVISPTDSAQINAHLWLCQTASFLVNDTTVSGFMNVQSDVASIRGSRWLYREKEGDRWTILSPSGDPWIDVENFDWIVDEHKGNLGFLLPSSPNMDGWQFCAVGVNALYSDTSCILTLHIIPTLEDGALQMQPELIEACSETFAEFKVFSETADLSKLSIDWQVKAAGDADWSANIDSLHNDTIYTIGMVGVDYNGYQVRAIAQGPCGSDTVEGRIVIADPLHPGVVLTSDSACFGIPLTITARDTGNAGHIRYIWYVNGTEVPGVEGETFEMSGYEAGSYEVRVVMIADTNTNACVIPKQATATDTAVVYPLPTVDAFIADTLIKTGFGTEVWATGNGTGYSWTPAGYVENAEADRTATIEFEHAGTYTFVVTTVNEFGCEASDSVSLKVISNFRLDSIPTTVVTPPILPNDDGSMPGLPEGSYPMTGEGVDVVNTTVFYGDEAHLWVCPGNEARVVIATSGGEKPIDYIWSREDGTAYPRDYKDTLTYYTEPNGIPEGWDGYGASTADYTIQDSIIVFFFPDTTTHLLSCQITDRAGSTLEITVHVHYFVPELIYIETRPKTTSTKFYEDQAVYFHARPQRYPDYYWIRLAGPEEAPQVTDMRASKEAMYPTSFKMENPNETHNQVWVSAIDRHGCRIWDSTSVQLMKLPNVMVIDDPTRPLGGVIFPEFEVEITNMWGLRIKAFRDRNGNGSTRGWDGRTPSGKKVTAGTYYYKVKIPTLDGFIYMSGAVTVVNR